MSGAALHVQAGVWGNHGGSHAVLCMEGEASDRANGGGLVADALYRVALGRGLHLTTDLEHLDLRPVPGWWVWIDPDGTLTLEWPRFRPLLEHVPLDLPGGWLGIAGDEHFVVVFIGYGLGDHPVRALEHAAEMGALASGVAPVRPGPRGAVLDQTRNIQNRVVRRTAGVGLAAGLLADRSGGPARRPTLASRGLNNPQHLVL